MLAKVTARLLDHFKNVKDGQMPEKDVHAVVVVEKGKTYDSAFTRKFNYLYNYTQEIRIKMSILKYLV